MSNASRRLFSSLLIALFALYYLNITLFPHSHQLGGVVIVHSHFCYGHTATDEPDNADTRSHLIVISDLSLFLTTANILSDLVFAFNPPIPFQYSALVVTQTTSFAMGFYQPRAPPVSI